MERPEGKKPKGCYEKANSPYWYADIQVAGQRWHGSTGCRTARAAEQFVADKRAELKNAADVAAGKALPVASSLPVITMGAAVELYENEKACRMSSYADMRRHGENLCMFLGVETPLHTITHRNLQQYYDARVGEKTIRKTPRKGSSVNREVAHMRQVWKHAKRNGYMVGLEPEWGEIIDLTAETVRIRELKPDEEERLFRVIRDSYPDMAGLVEFALLSGQRKSACTTLCWHDVNLIDREATFVLKTKGQNKRRHTIPLTDRMVEIIEAQPRVEDVDQVFTYVCIRGGQKTDDGPALIAGQRYPYTKWGWRKRWEDALKQAKVSDFRFHDLRHTTATRILRETNNLIIAQKLLGHTDLATTQRYAHAFIDDIRQGLDRVAASQDAKRVKRQQQLEQQEPEELPDNVVAFPKRA